MDLIPKMTTISDLSPELLCHIFKNLPLKDILAIGMLSKKIFLATKMYFRLCKSIDFCPSSVNGYMPVSITDEHLHALLKRIPLLETIYGLHPIKIERRRQRKRSTLTVQGIIEALNLCDHLKAIETSDLRLLEAIMQHLPHIEIIGHFQNRDGVFPPQASQKLKLQNFSRITSLHLIGVQVIELTAMQQLKHLHLHCVRFKKQQPFRSFLALNLRTFVMKHCIGPAVPLRYLSLIIALSASQNLNHLELVRVPFQGGSFYRAVEDSHGHGFTNLRTLVISGCKGVLESDLGHLMIVSSKNLETLYIQPSLTRDSLFVSLSFAQCRFPRLKHLHLGYIDSINISGKWSNEALITLGLAEIPDTPSSITDSGMKTVGQLLPHIKSLSVSNCPHLMTMYQWIPSVDPLSWTELTDLTLQKCHCLQLFSFTIFVSIVPRLQVIILFEMFKEPPKGCSHVGLSAGTGLGMSSAVVSNQDEHLAVQGGHPAQDFDHAGDEENEEHERELLDEENEDNQEPHFMLLRGDFFEEDDDIDYVEYENRCVNEALRQQDVMYDMMAVSSDSSSESSDIDEFAYVDIESVSRVEKSISKNSSADRNEGDYKNHNPVLQQDTDSQSIKSLEQQHLIKDDSSNQISDYDPCTPSTSKTETSSGSSSNVCCGINVPSTSKAKTSGNGLSYNPYEASTSKAGKSTNNKNSSLSKDSCYDPNNKASTSKSRSHLDCTNSECCINKSSNLLHSGKRIETQNKSSPNITDNKVSNHESSSGRDFHSEPAASKAGSCSNLSKGNKSILKRSHLTQKQNLSKKTKVAQIEDNSKHSVEDKMNETVNYAENVIENVAAGSESNVSSDNLCKPCFVRVVKLENDILIKEIYNKESDNMFISTGPSWVKSDSDNVTYKNEKVCRKNREEKTENEIKDMQEYKMPQLILDIDFLLYTNSVKLPLLHNSEQNRFRSVFYHPHLGTITYVPDRGIALDTSACRDGTNLNSGTSLQKYQSFNDISDQLQTNDIAVNGASSSTKVKHKKLKHSDCNSAKIPSNFKKTPTPLNSAPCHEHTCTRRRSTRQSRSNLYSNSPIESSRNLRSAIPAESSISMHDFRHCKPGTSQQSQSDNPSKLFGNFSNAKPNEFENYKDSNFYFLVTNDSRFPNMCYNSTNGAYFNARECSISLGEFDGISKSDSGFSETLDMASIPSTSRVSSEELYRKSINQKSSKCNTRKRGYKPSVTTDKKKQKLSMSQDNETVKGPIFKWRKPDLLKISKSSYDAFAGLNKSKIKSKKFIPPISLVSQGTQANSADIRRSVRRVRLATESARRATTSSSKACFGRKSSKISAKMGFKKPGRNTNNEIRTFDKATSTSDPLLEDDAVQILKISSETLLSFSIIACGISDLIIDQCPKLIHLDVQACRILKKLDYNVAPSIKRINISQCPKLVIQELAEEIMTLTTDSYFLVSYEPCMQAYHPGDGESAILEKARLNQTVMICHDFHEPSDESIQAKFQDKMMKWLHYLTKLPATLKYTREKNKYIKHGFGTTSFPYQHEVRRIHGEYMVPQTSEFCHGGQYQLFTNNRIIAEAFDTRKPNRGFPFLKDCETFKNNSLFSLEAMESHIRMYKNMIGFYIPITENNRTETYK